MVVDPLDEREFCEVLPWRSPDLPCVMVSGCRANGKPGGLRLIVLPPGPTVTCVTNSLGQGILECEYWRAGAGGRDRRNRPQGPGDGPSGVLGRGPG